METKTPTTSSYHHQRAPRTPESYFNVPESIALLNIVKSERIQSAFQSNRKNHASVWEMVAEVLNRFSARKRSAKQCCNRYENLKKIYTQLKKNPERHVRRNWPYMFLFKEIEEQRGECWGSANGKRLALIAKNQKELSYYHRRRQAAAAEYGVLMHKDVAAAAAAAAAQQSLLQSLANSTDSNSQHSNGKLERYLPNHFVEAQLTEGTYDEMPLHFPVPVGMRKEQGDGLHLANALTLARDGHSEMIEEAANHRRNSTGGGLPTVSPHTNGLPTNGLGLKEANITVNGESAMLNNNNHNNENGHSDTAPHTHNNANNNNNNSENNHSNHMTDSPLVETYEKDCNGALNLQTNEHSLHMKSEPMSDSEFNPDDITLMQTTYNGAQNFYPHNIDPNMLHPDVIVDTDNISDCSSQAVTLKSKRKLSTSTTDGDSTNYELIEYLKRREKRDEELLKRMDAREERLLNLLERTVVAIEALAHKNCQSKV